MYQLKDKLIEKLVRCPNISASILKLILYLLYFTIVSLMLFFFWCLIDSDPNKVCCIDQSHEKTMECLIYGIVDLRNISHTSNDTNQTDPLPLEIYFNFSALSDLFITILLLKNFEFIEMLAIRREWNSSDWLLFYSFTFAVDIITSALPFINQIYLFQISYILRNLKLITFIGNSFYILMGILEIFVLKQILKNISKLNLYINHNSNQSIEIA